MIPSGKFSVDRDALIRHFGAYSLSRGYDLIFSIPGPDIAGEDAVVVPVGAHSLKPHVPGVSALPVPFGKCRTFTVTGRDARPARSVSGKPRKDRGTLACCPPIRSLSDIARKPWECGA